jgi:Predicted membrane protein (DUF2142)
MRRGAMRVCLWAFLGSLLLQTAWILALPPFRGIDEFDHVYRAASVADGHWLPSGERPENGRGELVFVPPGIVRDAEPACSFLDYTGPDNCIAVETVEPGVVTVGSGAARYNPAFYSVIGSVAQPLDGAPAMYAMRAVSALLCSLLLAAAAWGTSLWARTRWPLVALFGVLTPVAMYTTALPAPNGVEMCGAAGLWAALLGFGTVDAGVRRRLLVLATVCAVPLTLVRGLGPLWLAAIVLVAWLHVGPRRTFVLLRETPRTTAACLGGVALVALAAVGWIVGGKALTGEETTVGGDPVVETMKQVPLWFLQSVAAFPMRDQPAPAAVYVAGGLAVLALLLAGWMRAARRGRSTLLLAFGLALLLPIGLTVMTYESSGVIWQGRYGWPVSMGVVLLAGALLDRRPPAHRWTGPALVAGWLLWAVAHVVSVTDLAVDEGRGVLAGDDRWWTLPPWTLGLLALAGVACWAVATRYEPDESSRLPSVGRAPALVSTRDS